MENLLYLSPVIIPLVEITKGLGVPSKFCPLIALLLGVLASFILPPTSEIWENVLSGIVLGLAAAGLYDAIGKTAISGVKKLFSNQS